MLRYLQQVFTKYLRFLSPKWGKKEHKLAWSGSKTAFNNYLVANVTHYNHCCQHHHLHHAVGSTGSWPLPRKKHCWLAQHRVLGKAWHSPNSQPTALLHCIEYRDVSKCTQLNTNWNPEKLLLNANVSFFLEICLRKNATGFYIYLT